MYCEKQKNRFPQWAADAALSRLVGRQRKFLVSLAEKKHRNRSTRTWSYTCIAAVNKMRFRHRNPFRESREPDPWGFVISRQRRKLSRKIDPDSAWADAEHKILDRYIRRTQSERRGLDFRWSYVLTRQREKIRLLENKTRRHGHPRAPDWNSIIRNALYFRLRRSYLARIRSKEAWQITLNGQIEKLRNSTQKYKWRACLLRNSGKLTIAIL
jgi:hypothetical protein